jgi:hypothetical protein
MVGTLTAVGGKIRLPHWMLVKAANNSTNKRHQNLFFMRHSSCGIQTFYPGGNRIGSSSFP